MIDVTQSRLKHMLGLLMAVVSVVVFLGVLASDARALQRGVVDIRLETFPASDVGQSVADLQSLGSSWTRLLVDWSRLQPNTPTDTDPGYSTAYVDQLESEAAALQAAGVHVIVSLYLVPEWASNKALWSSPPSGDFAKGVYQPFYAPDVSKTSIMEAYQGTCRYLAEHLSSLGVHQYECGNEPNLYCYQYPQVRAGDVYYGVKTYVAMLKRFHDGVQSGDRSAVVIAGSTSPRGGNDALSTAPQRFAEYLRSHGVTKFFDAYSHHPYVTGGQKVSPDPGRKPYSTRTVVTLYNIDQLLRLFPGKDFYITEYGFPSAYERNFGYGVTPVQQATYLRKAYSMAAKHRQIKVMLWYLVKDTRSVFTGLQYASGPYKPSWYAFAGGNRLTFTAPTAVKRSVSFTVSGTLTARDPVWRSGQRVQLQARPSTTKPWKVLKNLKVNSAGGYSFAFLKQSVTRQYRVVWPGVCESPVKTVRLKEVLSRADRRRGRLPQGRRARRVW